MQFPELEALKSEVAEWKYRAERLQMLLDSTVALSEQRMRRIFDLEEQVEAGDRLLENHLIIAPRKK